MDETHFRRIVVRRMQSVLLFGALFVSSVCYAGMEKEFLCRHCGLKGKYVQGNLLFARQIVAYCSNKDHLVNISWDYKKPALKPARFEGKVAVYVCPVCNTPTARGWDEKACPRCGSKNIKIKDTGMAVD